MKRVSAIVLFLFTALCPFPLNYSTAAANMSGSAYGPQNDEARRNRTKEQLEGLLDKVGPDIKVAFTPSQKQTYTYLGTLQDGLVNAQSFDIIINVTPKDTIGFRIYPHYKNAYINVDKVNDPAALMRFLLRLSDRAFLFWGVDEAGDIFTGYTVTLESGFPEEAIRIVLRSIVNSDKFVGEMRPILDAPPAAVTPTREPDPGIPSVRTPAAKAKAAARKRRRGRT